jgi:rubrerythrin
MIKTLESRELYPAHKDESGKIMYHVYNPMPSIPSDDPAPAHDRNDLTRCRTCGFLWLLSEMENGECPKCIGKQVSGGGSSPLVPYFELVEYQID